MIDQVVNNLSVTNITLAAVGLLVIRYFYTYIRDEITIRRLGGHAPRVFTWAPWGADLVWNAVQHAHRHENLQFWDYNFMNYGHAMNPYTCETYIGGRQTVFTVDPENIKAILATQFNEYGKGPQFHQDFEEFLGDGIFNTDHEKWQQSRQLIRPQFIKDRVSDLETFERHVSILLPLLGGNGREVDVKDLFFRYTLDAATDFLLGRSVGSLEHGEVAFAEAFGEIQRIQNTIARSGPLNWVIPRKELRRHLKVLNSFVEPYIEQTLRLSPEELEKRTKGEQGYTFLHALASYTRDRKVLRDQIVSTLLAGRDTTACTLSWMLYELSQNPELVTELRREVEQTVGLTGKPSYADLKSMKLLQYTMNETLRLYPVVPYNVRVALRNTTLPHGGGPDGNSPVGILKDTPVGYSTHYMQLTQGIYPPTSEKFSHPLTFDPHRWETWQPKPWTYIPFNGGPRLCVGQQFALTEMSYTLVRILQTFSRIDCRIPAKHFPTAAGTAADGGADPLGVEKGFSAKYSTQEKGLFPGLRGVGKSNVRRMAEGRQVKYKSEIVLQPAEGVRVAFWE